MQAQTVASKLREKETNLKRDLRRLRGRGLSGLEVEELASLERDLRAALRRVTLAKEKARFISSPVKLGIDLNSTKMSAVLQSICVDGGDGQGRKESLQNVLDMVSEANAISMSGQTVTSTDAKSLMRVCQIVDYKKNAGIPPSEIISITKHVSKAIQQSGAVCSLSLNRLEGVHYRPTPVVMHRSGVGSPSSTMRGIVPVPSSTVGVESGRCDDGDSVSRLLDGLENSSVNDRREDEETLTQHDDETGNCHIRGEGDEVHLCFDGLNDFIAAQRTNPPQPHICVAENE
mgnify:CR=1 FL=1